MKIFLGINVLSHIAAGPYCSHMAFMAQSKHDYPDSKIYLYTPERCSIDRMRNECARLALELECDYLMFVDDDVIIDPKTLKSLVEANADIAMAETYIRGYPFDVMFFKGTKDANGKIVGLSFFNDYKEHVDENGLLNVDAVGFSCVLIKCSMLRQLTTPYFITNNGADGGAQFTEDVYFCLKAVDELGRDNLKIVVDTKVPTGHQMRPEVVSVHNAKLLKEFAERENKELVKVKNHDRGSEYAESVEELFITAPDNLCA